MRKVKICLLGKHANRTPLSYTTYRAYAGKHVEIVSNIDEADVIMSGFVYDFREHFEELAYRKTANKRLKLMIISEEPLWDTLWGGDDIRKRWTIIKGPRGTEVLNVRHINYYNSDFFDFNYIPYFLTTDGIYLLRYLQLWSSYYENREMPTIAKGKIPIRGIFQKREHDKYVSKSEPSYSLSVFRTNLASELIRRESNNRGTMVYSTSIRGNGWSNSPTRRQDLGDWHFDKLASISKRPGILFSLENTIANNYISEKIFDSIFTGNIPIYFRNDLNRAGLTKIFGSDFAGISLDTLNPQNAADHVIDQLVNHKELLSESIAMMHILGTKWAKNMTRILEFECRQRSRKLLSAIWETLG